MHGWPSIGYSSPPGPIGNFYQRVYFLQGIFKIYFTIFLSHINRKLIIMTYDKFLAYLLSKICQYDLNTPPISAESQILGFNFSPKGLAYSVR